MKFLCRNVGLVLLAASMVIALVFSAAMMWTERDFLTNVGFLVLGALLAVFVSLLSEAIKRPQQSRDLARALYEELADRVARCCFDFEDPWGDYADSRRLNDKRDAFSMLKFLPESPTIFEATADQLALLGEDAPGALIRFYYCHAAWRRDLANRASELQRTGRDATPDELVFLGERLKQTLAPGLKALQTLSPFVGKHASIDETAIAGYDDLVSQTSKHPTQETLRERISKLIA